MRGSKWTNFPWYLAGLIAVSIMLFSGCSRAPEEQRLRDSIEAMQVAVLERRAGDFMERVAEDFIGAGGIDRAALHNLLRAQMLRNASIGATLGPLEVKLQGERAQVDFDAVLTGGAGGMLPERAQAYAIKTGWRLEQGEWRLFHAEWEPRL
jgi:hypothetical protein